MSYSGEQSVVFRFDNRLGSYLDDIDLDMANVEDFARKIHVPLGIQRYARMGAPAEPVTVNLNAGYKYGTTGLQFGQYNVTEQEFDGLRPADIDIFFGSYIRHFAGQNPDQDVSAAVAQHLDEAIKEELVHFADPLFEYRKYSADQIAGLEAREAKESERIREHPGIAAVFEQLAADKLAAESKFSRVSKRSALAIGGVATAAGATYGYETHQTLSGIGATAAIILFLGVFRKAYLTRRGQDIDDAVALLRSAEYTFDPAEILAKGLLAETEAAPMSKVQLKCNPNKIANKIPYSKRTQIWKAKNE